MPLLNSRQDFFPKGCVFKLFAILVTISIIKLKLDLPYSIRFERDNELNTGQALINEWEPLSAIAYISRSRCGRPTEITPGRWSLFCVVATISDQETKWRGLESATIWSLHCFIRAREGCHRLDWLTDSTQPHFSRPYYFPRPSFNLDHMQKVFVFCFILCFVLAATAQSCYE